MVTRSKHPSCALLILSMAWLAAGCGGPESIEDPTTAAQAACPIDGCPGAGEPPPLPPCTRVTYGNWSRCSGSGWQTRTVISRYPARCTVQGPLSQACTSYDVGIIPAGASCGDGTDPDIVSSIPITFGMDNRDMQDWGVGYSGDTKLTGNAGAISVAGGGNTVYSFCRVDGQRFYPLYTAEGGGRTELDFAVLQLGTDCPNGSFSVGRFFDNENNNNANWPKGLDIAPGWIQGDTYLKFCVFRYAPAGALVQRPPCKCLNPLGGSLDTCQATICPSALGQAGGGAPVFTQYGTGLSYFVLAGPNFVETVLPKGTLLQEDEAAGGNKDRFDLPPAIDPAAVYNIIDGAPRPVQGPYGESSPNHTRLRFQQVASW